MNPFVFSLPQILALVGLVQCLYVMGFMTVRTAVLGRRFVPLAYFFILAGAFAVDLFSAFIPFHPDIVFLLQWVLWFFGPTLSVLLVLQLAAPERSLVKADCWVLLLLPFSFFLSLLASQKMALCGASLFCADFKALLMVTGLVPGTISLLVIFSKTDLLANLPRQKHGIARYWLIIALIVLNVLLLAAALLHGLGSIADAQILAVRNLLGLGFVYSASTLLFRIVSSSPRLSVASNSDVILDEKEQKLVQQIEKLLDLEKVYQEPTYSRMDLARECGVTEALVSKVINIHFGKSFPQLINERRIEDAKQLLRQTGAPIAQIASEVGFNSLPSFNRVFKEYESVSPSAYRKALLDS